MASVVVGKDREILPSGLVGVPHSVMVAILKYRAADLAVPEKRLHDDQLIAGGRGQVTVEPVLNRIQLPADFAIRIGGGMDVQIGAIELQVIVIRGGKRLIVNNQP